MFFQALAGVRTKLPDRPVAPRHADDGDIELLVAHQSLEYRIDLFFGQIAGRAEKDERV